jgi:folate-dependent phosphoribosylglycinamide formyltransferase PurN
MMARKARKKSAAKTKKKAKKKPIAVKTKKRKAVTNKTAARKKVVRKAKPKGVIATVVGGFEAVVDTLTDAERLQQKLQPHVPSDPE